MTDAPEPTVRGRQPRVDAERTERRRREGLGDERNLRLSVPNKDPNYVYRWINDDPGRVHRLTVEDDWDIVAADGTDKRNVGVGTSEQRVVSREGQKAVLVRKRKEYYEADKAKEQTSVDRREDALRHGMAPGESSLKPTDQLYIPKGGISIGRT